LEQHLKKRLAVVSFIVKGTHHNLFAKLLNDHFGLQARGGCSCAGTYGHRLLQVDLNHSYKILEALRADDLSAKPGWIRVSIHPTMSNAEVEYMMDAIELTAAHIREWSMDYRYNIVNNEYDYSPSVTKLQPISGHNSVFNYKGPLIPLSPIGISISRSTIVIISIDFLIRAQALTPGQINHNINKLTNRWIFIPYMSACPVNSNNVYSNKLLYLFRY